MSFGKLISLGLKDCKSCIQNTRYLISIPNLAASVLAQAFAEWLNSIDAMLGLTVARELRYAASQSSTLALRASCHNGTS